MLRNDLTMKISYYKLFFIVAVMAIGGGLFLTIAAHHVNGAAPVTVSPPYESMPYQDDCRSGAPGCFTWTGAKSGTFTLTQLPGTNGTAPTLDAYDGDYYQGTWPFAEISASNGAGSSASALVYLTAPYDSDYGTFGVYYDNSGGVHGSAPAVTVNDTTGMLNVSGSAYGGSTSGSCKDPVRPQENQIQFYGYDWYIVADGANPLPAILKAGSEPNNFLGQAAQDGVSGCVVTDWQPYGYLFNFNVNISSLANGTYDFYLLGQEGNPAISGTVYPLATAQKKLSFTVAWPVSSITSFKATPPSVNSGSASALSWTSVNTTGCTLSGGIFGSGKSEPVSESSLSTGNLTTATTYSLTCQNSHNSAGPDTVTVSINAPQTGTITVESTNYETGTAIPMTWYFWGPPKASCPSTAPCSSNGDTETLLNQPAGVTSSYTIEPTAPAGFSLRSIELNPVAEAPNTFLGKIVAFSKDLFGRIAEAFTFPKNETQNQTLLSGKTIDFGVEWYPLAAFTVSPGSLTLTTSSPTGVVNVSNSGSDGSTLNWTATYAGSCTYNGVPTSTCSWIMASPLNGSLGATDGTPITVTASPSGLALGTWGATITFTGTSDPGGSVVPPPQPVQVTFTKNSLNCPGDNGCAPVPKCAALTANPSQIVVPANSNLSDSCTEVANNGCTLTDQNNNSYSGGITYQGPDSYGGYTATVNQNVAPTQNTDYTLDCQGVYPNNPNYVTSATVSVSVSNPGRTECPPQGCQP